MHRNNAQTSGKAKNFKGSLAKLGPYLKPYLFWIILAIFFSIVGSFSSLSDRNCWVKLPNPAKQLLNWNRILILTTLPKSEFL